MSSECLRTGPGRPGRSRLRFPPRPNSLTGAGAYGPVTRSRDGRACSLGRPYARNVPPLRKTVLVIAPPLVLAAAGLIHPRDLTAASAARWAGLHVVLLPVFPLLAVGLLVPLGWRPRRDLSAVGTVVAWLGAAGYAAYYTGLDAVAGIAAGTAEQHGVSAAVPGLFAAGDRLGQAGAYALLVASVATSLVLFSRHGAGVLPGALILLVSCFSFIDSHIFWPRGVFTMLGFAAAFVLLLRAAGRPPRPGGRQRPGPAGEE